MRLEIIAESEAGELMHFYLVVGSDFSSDFQVLADLEEVCLYSFRGLDLLL